MNTIQIINKGAYTIIRLHRGRANVINMEMVTELRDTFQQLRDDRACRGIILTGQPNFFSAGLDVIELYDYDGEEIANFFKAFGSLYIDMVKFPKPLIAGITGHSPAGGTVMAITADYRIMAEGPKYTLGLNEVAVNIQISRDIIKGYSFWIGEGKAHKYILEGKLLTVKEAHDCNLIDKIVAADQVIAHAEEQMQTYLQADDQILKQTKHELRRDWIDKLSTEPGAAFERSLETWWRPEIRTKMKLFVDYLKNK